MPAYVLRHAGTNLLAGFYFADREVDLFDLIDRDGGTEAYEYTIIRDGFGIEFRTGEGTVEVALDDPKMPAKLAKAKWVLMTDELLWGLAESKTLEWRKILSD